MLTGLRVLWEGHGQVQCVDCVLVVGSKLCRVGFLIGLRRCVSGPMVEWLVLGMFGEVWCGEIQIQGADGMFCDIWAEVEWKV